MRPRAGADNLQNERSDEVRKGALRPSEINRGDREFEHVVEHLAYRKVIVGKVASGVIAVTVNGNEMTSFDLEGRVLYYATDSSTYRRSIYNEVYRLDWLGNDKRIVEKLLDPSKVLERAYEVAKEAKRLTEDSILRNAIETPASRNFSWLSEDSKKVAKIYDRISIVPPDLYFSVYLQLTRGCSWNRCAFCSLYRDKNYFVKSAEEFSEHIRAVKKYLGRGVEARRSVFLGDANAMDVPQELLEDILVKIGNEFSNPPVYSFVDAFTTPKNLARMDFPKLRRLGLRRMYLGLESGDSDVLEILNKPMKLEEAKEFVRHLKSAGINLGIIILVGAGGHRFWKDHVNETCALLEGMSLGRGDIAYLSPLIESESYKTLAKDLNLGILSEKEKEKQIEEILVCLKKSGKVNSPIVRYDVRESFVS